MSRCLALAVLTLLLGCGPPAPPDPQLVAQWLRASGTLTRNERLEAPVASRISAYASLALFEGYAADRSSNLRSLAGQLNGLWSVPIADRDTPVDGATVAAEAERVVLDSLFAEGHAGTALAIDSLARTQIASRRSAGVGAELSARSVEHGRALARVILAWAATDGFIATRGRRWTHSPSIGKWSYSTSTDPRARERAGGAEVVLAGSAGPAPAAATADAANSVDRSRARDPRTTLPQFNPLRAVEPYWGRLRPFAMRGGEECAPPAPPTYSERRGSDFWKMGRELLDSVATMTPAKREIALFWADNESEASTPALHWMEIVEQMIARRHLTADAAVEAYALSAVAIADAFIGCWKEKYRFMAVRPSTYVRRVFDATWQSVSVAPTVPEHPSAQATLSGAASAVLVR